MERIVKVYPTGGKTVEVTTSATTWGELKRDLSALTGNDKVQLDGRKAIIGESKLQMVADSSLLPDSAFSLLTFPVKTKSGAKVVAVEPNVRTEIKNIIVEFGDSAKDFFNEGQNYTRKDNATLSDLLKAWNKKPKAKKTAAPVKKASPAKKTIVAKKAPAKKVSPKKTSAIDSVVSSVADKLRTPASKSAKKVVSGITESLSDLGRVSEAINLVSDVSDTRVTEYRNDAIDDLVSARTILAGGTVEKKPLQIAAASALPLLEESEISKVRREILNSDSTLKDY